MKMIFEKKREWSRIAETPKILYLINEKVKGKSFFLKNSFPPAEFYPSGTRDTSILFYHTPDLPLGERITLYMTVTRQLEVDFQVREVPEPGTILLEPLEARIGKSVRNYPRFDNSGDEMYASNFKVRRSDITDTARTNVSSSILFKDAERRLSMTMPGLRIETAGRGALSTEEKAIGNEDLSIFVANVMDPQSYESPGEGYLDYRRYLEDEGIFEAQQKKYRNSYVNSILAMPVRYEQPGEDPVNIAYICLEGRGDFHVDENVHAQLKQAADEIVQRITDANAVHIKARQKILNISEMGIALQVDHEELMRYLPQKNWLTFDLVFRKQAPIRLHAQVCHIKEVARLYVIGLSFEGSGHSSHRLGSLEHLRAMLQDFKKREV